MFLKFVSSLLLIFNFNQAHAETLCGRVAINPDGRYSLVRDIANLGTSGGYPIRKVYRIDDEARVWSRHFRRHLDEFVCIPGYHDTERPLTFVAAGEPGDDQ